MGAARPSIMAVVADREWCEHLRSALDSWTALTIVSKTWDLVEQSQLIVPDVALWHLGAPSDADDDCVSALRRFRRRSPRTVVLAYCAVSRHVAPLLVAAGHAGIDGLLLRGYDDLAASIRDRLVYDGVGAASNDVVQRTVLPEGLAQDVFAHCVRRAATTVLTVEQLAAELHVNRRTLQNWVRDAGLPSPERIIGWSRLLLVAILLETPSRSVVSVTARVGFSSVAALRSMLSRYAGLKLKEIRQGGGFTRLHAAFQRALLTASASEPVLSTVSNPVNASVGDRATPV
jgi:AraC-like DNA-binding protein